MNENFRNKKFYSLKGLTEFSNLIKQTRLIDENFNVNDFLNITPEKKFIYNADHKDTKSIKYFSNLYCIYMLLEKDLIQEAFDFIDKNFDQEDKENFNKVVSIFFKIYSIESCRYIFVSKELLDNCKSILSDPTNVSLLQDLNNTIMNLFIEKIQNFKTSNITNDLILTNTYIESETNIVSNIFNIIAIINCLTMPDIDNEVVDKLISELEPSYRSLIVKQLETICMNFKKNLIIQETLKNPEDGVLTNTPVILPENNEASDDIVGKDN